ncbi:MAG: hypothetical protein A2Z20_00770 [Bdellovibrionales bacterium RBG_16_40_8]|nr:MAG: hypothetical protein A2Z20_00770 [Bdellovibrionales bacterium RBG_16_40_8]
MAIQPFYDLYQLCRMLKGRVVTHTKEHRVINKIANLRQAGASYGAIAEWLNSKCLPIKNRVIAWDRPTVFKF